MKRSGRYRDGLNAGFQFHQTLTLSSQRMSAFLKVFQCGPRHDIGGQELVAHVDKPRKEEAAGVLDHPMGKVRRGLERLLRQGFWLKVRMVPETGTNALDDT